MQEVWKNINEHYQASNLGRIKSLEVKNYNAGGRTYSKKERILKFGMRSDGYYIVNVAGFMPQRRTWKVHQIIANVFIPNPNNYKVINHKNGIKTDNRVENLEWCSHSENTKHSFEVLKQQPTKIFGEKNTSSKKVIDITTNEIFPTIRDAAKRLGIKDGTLAAMLNGRNKNRTSMRFYEKEA